MEHRMSKNKRSHQQQQQQHSHDSSIFFISLTALKLIMRYLNSICQQKKKTIAAEK